MKSWNSDNNTPRNPEGIMQDANRRQGNINEQKDSQSGETGTKMRTHLVSMIHQNLRSLGNSVDMLQVLLNSNKDCHFLCVTEHWKSSLQLESYRLLGYELISSYCRNEGEHGGSAVYAKSGMQGRPRNDLTDSSVYKTIECAAAEFKLFNMKIIVLCIYRPDTVSDIFLHKLEEILLKIIQEKCLIFIAGDFNIDIKKEDKLSSDFLLLLNSYNLYPTVLEYTRITSETRSCIDNIYTNTEQFTSRIIHTHISDHTAQKVTFEINENLRNTFYKKRSFNLETKINFVELLSHETWQDVYSCNERDVNRQWQGFMNTFVPIFNECFQFKSFKINSTVINKITYNSPEIIGCKQQLDILLVLSQSDTRYADTYNSVKKKYNKLLMQNRSNHYAQRLHLSDNKSKSTWQIVREITGSKKEGRDNIPGDPDIVANELNTFFVNTASRLKLNEEVEFTTRIESNQKSIFITPVTISEIETIAEGLKNKLSSGIDEIPVTVIKFCIYWISEPLCYIMNNSFTQGIFPDQLKVASVKPLLKKGNPSLADNYRPLSILPSFSKIFETAMCNRMIKFFDACKIFSISQHGYLKNRSVETGIHYFIQRVVEALEAREIPLGIFLDLTKAFDCLDHSILITKLELYGIRGTALQWIESYLFGRSQKVMIGHNGRQYASGTLPISGGIPQGSIIGPLFFILYINDLPTIISENSTHLINYADDTNLLIRGKVFSELIKQCDIEIQQVKLWFDKNKLVINKDKTNCIIFKTKQSNLPTPDTVHISDWNLTPASDVKFLGIYIDDTMSWSVHIENLCKRLSSVCYCMRVLAAYVEYDTLKVVYHANFLSLLRYGIIFFGSSVDFQKVFVVQKRIIRIMCKMCNRESCRGVFRKGGLLTAAAVYIYEVVIFLYKHKEIVRDYRFTHNYGTRHSNYVYPQHRLTLSERTLLYAGIKFFNRLPEQLKGIECIYKFKGALFNYLNDIEPYNVGEFLTHVGG